MSSLVIVIIVFIAFASGQDCGQKFTNFKTCVKGQIETAAKQPNPQLATLKSGVDNCYKTANCTAPSDDDDDDGGDSKQCKRLFKAEVIKEIEACVQTAFPKLSVPQRPQTAGGPQQGRHLAPKRLDDACKNGGNKTQAEQCLRTLFLDNKPNATDLKQKFDAVCSKVGDCKKELAGCEAQVEAVKTKICQCAKETKSKSATIRAGISQCAGVTEKPKSPPKGASSGAADGDKDCQEIQTDQCEKGFDAFKQKFLAN